MHPHTILQSLCLSIVFQDLFRRRPQGAVQGVRLVTDGKVANSADTDGRMHAKRAPHFRKIRSSRTLVFEQSMLDGKKSQLFLPHIKNTLVSAITC